MYLNHFATQTKHNWYISYEIYFHSTGTLLWIYESITLPFQIHELVLKSNFRGIKFWLYIGGPRDGGGCGLEQWRPIPFMQFSEKIWLNTRSTPQPLGLTARRLGNPGAATVLALFFVQYTVGTLIKLLTICHYFRFQKNPKNRVLLEILFSY